MIKISFTLTNVIALVLMLGVGQVGLCDQCDDPAIRASVGAAPLLVGDVPPTR